MYSVSCWKKANLKKKNTNNTPKDEGSHDRDEMNALLISGMADGHRMREDHDTKEVLLDHNIFDSH